MKKQNNDKAKTVSDSNPIAIPGPKAGEDNPPTSLLGVVVKVENLDIARAFYRDVLELGAPVMDSTFWVEFKIGNNASLFLEQAHPEEKLVPTKGRVAWICETSNIDCIVDKLRELGHEPASTSAERAGYQVLQFQDPEGNPFYLRPVK